MNRAIRHTLAAVIAAGLLATATQLPAADGLAWLDAYNVVWTSQSRDSGESMPCGGHSIGLNVWVEKGELLFYMQRSGSFDENNEYLKLGRVRVRLDPNPFAEGADFRQELKLRQGLVEIAGKKGNAQAVARLWVEAQRPVVHLEIESVQPVEVQASYENWRQNDEVLPVKPGKGARFGCMSWEEYPGDVTRYRDEVRHEASVSNNRSGAVLFYHRNRDDKLLFDYVVRQQGLEKVKDRLVNTQKGRTFGGILRGDGFVADGTTTGQYLRTPFTAWRLRSARPAKRHHLQVFTNVAQTESLQKWRDALDGMVAVREPSLDKARRATAAWWSEFWNRSRIVIAPDRRDENYRPWQIARNYQLFRYQLGCNARGEYPTKFNGGNFTFDPSLVNKNRPYSPDWRAWGGGSFTAQNQRLVHWPMLKAGDADLMLPQLEFYRRILPNAEARVREYWGHDGCLCTEQTENFGLPMACAGAGRKPAPPPSSADARFRSAIRGPTGRKATRPSWSMASRPTADRLVPLGIATRVLLHDAGTFSVLRRRHHALLAVHPAVGAVFRRALPGRAPPAQPRRAGAGRKRPARHLPFNLLRIVSRRPQPG